MTIGEKLLHQLDAAGIRVTACANGCRVVLHPAERVTEELHKRVKENMASLIVAIEARELVARGERDCPQLCERGWVLTAAGWKHPNLSGAHGWPMADALQLETERAAGDARAVLLLETTCPS